MYAIVGLGNPGPEYAKTRHNVGFWVVDGLAESLLGSGRANWREKSGNEYLKTSLAGEDLLLVKPQKFMNLSGEALQPLLHFFQVDSKEIIVVYDELDFAPGIVRVRRGGSAGGHRGLGNIVERLGTQDFLRVRVGIGHPRDGVEPGRPFEDVGSYVLKAPKGDERKRIESGVAKADLAVRLLLERGLEVAQREIHREGEG